MGGGGGERVVVVVVVVAVAAHGAGARPSAIELANQQLALHRAKAFLREMAQPAAPSQNVSLDRDELGRSAGYVARVATAAIAAHPLQATETLHGAVSAEPPPAAQPMDTG